MASFFSLGNEDRGGEYFDVSSMNLLFDNHRISNSPSKIEGVGGSMTSSYSIVAREVPQC